MPAILPILLSLLGSRLGQIGMAFVVGWGMAWWKTDADWRAYVATEKVRQEAIFAEERHRQDDIAKEMATEATQRLTDEQAAVADMQQQIAEMGDAKDPCVLTDDDVRRVQQFDRGVHPQKAPKRTR